MEPVRAEGSEGTSGQNRTVDFRSPNWYQATTRRVVCLIGRRKDWRLLREAEVELTLAGHIVLTVGCIGPDGPTIIHDEAAVKACQQLHFDKIALSTEVMLVSSQPGEGTLADIEVALRLGKVIRFYKQVHQERLAIMEKTQRFGFYGIYEPDANTYYQIGY
jgi:hypothetical protein